MLPEGNGSMLIDPHVVIQRLVLDDEDSVGLR